ncbi:helix-turn-helix domain-containing protein [Herbidospora daliensis]|uniref:helix-turn-helix domain-containing protein n=1 Tax=Herbidospora daliensis TaxID=295585 RepID=UPI00078087A1|nr:helix-turn-helix transcriptional regulator [Herbidospora daliensis]
MAGTNLTLRRRQLAARLKQLRQESGLTLEEVCTPMHASTAKLSRLETGQRGASPRDVEILTAIYGISDPSVIAELIAMAADSRTQLLRREYGSLGNRAIYSYIDMEAAASAITEFQTAVIPGLLQIEDYARTVIRHTSLDHVPERVEKWTRARMLRQRLLTSNHPPKYEALVDEAVLWRVVGEPDIMCRQIEHIIPLAEAGRVTLRILPFQAGPYPADDSPFVLFDIADLPTRVVWRESFSSLDIIEGPSEVAAYRRVIDHLTGIALSPAASIDFLCEMRDHYANGGPDFLRAVP